MSANNFGHQLGEALMQSGHTQQSFSMEVHTSREAISAYKTGRATAPADIKSKSVLLTDNPFLAIAAAYESTAGTSPAILDGANVELNRHTVTAKTAEEIKELLEAIDRIQPILIKPQSNLKPHEREQIEYLIQQTLDVVTSTTNMAAVLTKESRLSWITQWTKHKTKLVTNGFIKMFKEGIGL